MMNRVTDALKNLFNRARQFIFIIQYGRHLKKRFEKNDFGRREEW